MALVLSIKPGGSFFVGDDVTVTFHGMNTGEARISIDAPRSVPIDREEVRARKEMDARGYDSDDERWNR